MGKKTIERTSTDNSADNSPKGGTYHLHGMVDASSTWYVTQMGAKLGQTLNAATPSSTCKFQHHD